MRLRIIWPAIVICALPIASGIAGAETLPGAESTVQSRLKNATEVAAALTGARDDLAKLRAVQTQLAAEAPQTSKRKERDAIGVRVVRALNEVASSPAASAAQKREAITLWMAIYKEGGDWKPPFFAFSPISGKYDVDGLRAGAFELLLAARGEAGRKTASEATLWLVTLTTFGSRDGNGEWRKPQAEKVLATPDAVPEARQWALAILANAGGDAEKRIAWFRELVAMPHLSPTERAGLLKSYAYFLQGDFQKEKAKAVWEELARDARLPLEEREAGYLNLFNAATDANKIALADELLRLPQLPNGLRFRWLTYRAGAFRDSKRLPEAIAAFDQLAALPGIENQTLSYARFEAAKLRFAADPKAGRAALSALVDDAGQGIENRLEAARMVAGSDFAAKDYANASKVLESATKIAGLDPVVLYDLRFNLANMMAANKNYAGTAVQIDLIPIQTPMPAFEKKFLEQAFALARQDKDTAGATALLNLMKKRKGWHEADIKLQTALLKEDAGDRAGAIALYKEILPAYTGEADRKYIQDVITRLEQPAP